MESASSKPNLISCLAVHVYEDVSLDNGLLLALSMTTGPGIR
jgi:hypothetical protein